MTTQKSTIKVAAVGDIHVGLDSTGLLKPIFTDISEKADILVLCGDLTNTGQAEEAKILAGELTSCRVPVVVVLGNHDYERDENEEIRKILSNENVHVLEGESFVYKDVGFAGIKGFGGGYDSYMLAAFGEPEIKDFVKKGVDDSLRLENALQMLDTEKKVVLMHYSPIFETLIGEPEQIFPFLGSSRLEEPLDHFNVSACFHGHAHKGTYEGKTQKGIPVYNVAMPIMKERNEKQPYALVEI